MLDQFTALEVMQHLDNYNHIEGPKTGKIKKTDKQINSKNC